MSDIRRLEQAIKDLHGLESRHVATVMVQEKCRGAHLWGGIVEVFELKDHAEAAYAYAWAYLDENGTIRDVAVLGAPPVESPQDAVHAFIVSRFVRESD